jgi:curli biogenesis system outer membrane secretion channel CsgG
MKNLIHLLKTDKTVRSLTLAVILVLISLAFFGCTASIKTEKYTAQFEKAKSGPKEVYNGPKQTVQISDLKVNKELWEAWPELREKRVGMGISNRIIENFEETGRFEFAEEKEAVLNKVIDVWEKEADGLGDGKTKIQVGSLRLPKYIVYAEIYDFAVSYGETYENGKIEKTNTTIVGIQIRVVRTDNSQYIVASGQGTSTQVGEGFFKDPNMQFDMSTVGISTQKALEVATDNLIQRMIKYGW